MRPSAVWITVRQAQISPSTQYGFPHNEWVPRSSWYTCESGARACERMETERDMGDTVNVVAGGCGRPGPRAGLNPRCTAPPAPGHSFSQTRRRPTGFVKVQEGSGLGLVQHIIIKKSDFPVGEGRGLCYGWAAAAWLDELPGAWEGVRGGPDPSLFVPLLY